MEIARRSRKLSSRVIAKTHGKRFGKNEMFTIEPVHVEKISEWYDIFTL